MKFYIAINGHHEGPFDVQQLRAHNLTPDTLVWNEMMSGWTRAAEVPYLVDNYFNAPACAQDSMPEPPRQTTEIPRTTPPMQPQGQPQYHTGNNRQPGYAPGGCYEEQPLCPSSWLVPSILVTIFCCLPAGIVGIVYASKVSNLYYERRYAEAERAASTARKWCIGGIIASVAATVAYLLFLFFFVSLGVL